MISLAVFFLSIAIGALLGYEIRAPVITILFAAMVDIVAWIAIAWVLQPW